MYAGQGKMFAGGDRMRSTYHWRRNDLYFGGLIQFHVQYNNFITMYVYDQVNIDYNIKYWGGL